MVRRDERQQGNGLAGPGRHSSRTESSQTQRTRTKESERIAT